MILGPTSQGRRKPECKPCGSTAMRESGPRNWPRRRAPFRRSRKLFSTNEMHRTLSSRRRRLLIVNTYKNRHFLTLVLVFFPHFGSVLSIGWYRAKKDAKHASSLWISCSGQFLTRVLS